MQVQFRQWETIHTEVSLKYDEAMIKALADQAGLQMVSRFFDSKKYFCHVLLKRNKVLNGILRALKISGG
jgi:L-histidine N-alpha-methyltransferase